MPVVFSFPVPPFRRRNGNSIAQRGVERNGVRKLFRVFFFTTPAVCHRDTIRGPPRPPILSDPASSISERGDARAPRTTRTRGVVTRGLDGHPRCRQSGYNCRQSSQVRAYWTWDEPGVGIQTRTDRARKRRSPGIHGDAFGVDGGGASSVRLDGKAPPRRSPGVRCARDGTAVGVRPFSTTVPATAFLRRVRTFPPRPLRTPCIPLPSPFSPFTHFSAFSIERGTPDQLQYSTNAVVNECPRPLSTRAVCLPHWLDIVTHGRGMPRRPQRSRGRTKAAGSAPSARWVLVL